MDPPEFSSILLDAQAFHLLTLVMQALSSQMVADEHTETTDVACMRLLGMMHTSQQTCDQQADT